MMTTLGWHFLALRGAGAISGSCVVDLGSPRLAEATTLNRKLHLRLVAK